MTAVEAAVRPTKAAVRSRRYFRMFDLVVMTRPPKFVGAFLGQTGFAFATLRRDFGFFNRFDCFV